MQEITVRILRYKPKVIEPARFETYPVKVDPHMSVMDTLEKIRLHQQPTLVYRHSCHHGSCGTCACRINGTEALACTTKVMALDSPEVRLEPLNGFEPIADLAVAVAPLFRDIDPGWSYLRAAEAVGNAEANFDNQRYGRFENCIECGSCVSACPVSQTGKQFMGPAVLAAIHRELLKSPSKTEELLELAGGQRGERWCQRALACSRVCPTGVYPARHIADIRRHLEKK